jgi:hypothetical protein
MAVNIYENEELTKVGEPYQVGSSLTRAEFERLKALGQ